MTKHAVWTSIAAGLVLVSAAGASAQDRRTVSGTVTDSTGQPIPYVNLDGGPRYRTLTNASGEWTMLLPPSESIEIAIRRIGYLPVKIRVERGADTTIAVSMQRLAVLLETQVVRAQQQVRTLELRGFYSRMLESQRGALVGEFVTPEEIEMRNPQRVTQLLEQRRGLQVRRFGNCYVIDECYRVIGTAGCAATIYLDGQRLNRLTDASADIRSAPIIDGLITVTSVSGIEVYPRGSSAPAKYQTLAGTCSVVLIWTK
jgi:hypothetical protein